ncbi:helix-turn-helix domain-containing protein [Aliivibrio fischeri]|uniref:Helix-turn-helix domain-containing protein n=1 Tax=Aliivibrio fischeri TaxID=668 RepID=A0A510UMM8_ALIFS|nr:AraC family transcriptional regulator [Aliivibrio fischeri]MUK51225.1 helix-turn-helix domain-containing protein [Aliivibrio fischeri]GEK15923.1 hypothetical protein AFI02nite_39590 [Aliivibrio fischeri]
MSSLSTIYPKCKNEENHVVSSKLFKVGINNLGCDWGELLTITKTTESMYFYGSNKSQTIYVTEQNSLCLFYSATATKWKTNDNKGILKQGGVVLFDCNQPFTYSVNQSNSIILIIIPYQIYDAENITKMLEGRGFIYSRFILSILREIDNDNVNALKNKLFSLINILPVVSENHASNKRLSLFERIKKIIHAHALDNFFSLDKASSLSFCSKRKLHNCLAKEGTSYSKMIHEYRIEYFAEQLIIDRQAKVKTLCYKSGFNSPSYAAKQFKLVKGVTPVRYRRTF